MSDAVEIETVSETDKSATDDFGRRTPQRLVRLDIFR